MIAEYTKKIILTPLPPFSSTVFFSNTNKYSKQIKHYRSQYNYVFFFIKYEANA